MSTYTAQLGMDMVDICLNATGNLTNLDTVLDANSFTTWTPDVVAGQIITIPDSLVTTDPNTIRQLALYPSVQNLDSATESDLNAVFATLNNNWILSTGFWNDNSVWNDNAYWID
jgi:hypothetical protein